MVYGILYVRVSTHDDLSVSGLPTLTAGPSEFSHKHQSFMGHLDGYLIGLSLHPSLMNEGKY